MDFVSNEFRTYVLDDLKKYEGLSHPVRASILERIMVHEVPLDKLHPNPDDEFCSPAIGPSYDVVEAYQKHFIQSRDLHISPMDEPILVEKMSTGGYMILNGHHRWFAAHRAGLWKVPVEIANVVSEETILSKIDRSQRDLCVSFDFDEVLLTDGSEIEQDHELSVPYRWVYKQSLRKNAGALINELQNLGFDVWIYSGNYHSEQYIKKLLSLHNAKVDGIVNFVKGKKGDSNLKNAFRQKYRLSVHVDNEGVMWINNRTKDYDSIPIDMRERDWAAGAFALIKSLDLKQS